MVLLGSSDPNGAALTTSDKIEMHAKPPELEILIAVKVLHAVFQDCIELHLRGISLPRTDLHMIAFLSQPTRLGRLAEDMRILPSAMTAIADRLEEQGIVCRIRDQEDRRAWLLQLTAKGAEVQAEMFAAITETFSQTTGLSSEETLALHGLMTKVSQHIDKTGYPEGLEL